MARHSRARRRTQLAFLFALSTSLAGFACGDSQTGGVGSDRDDPDAGMTADVGSPEEDAGRDDVSVAPPDAEFPRQVVAVETEVLSAVMSAGDTLAVTCTLLDEDGLPVDAADPEADFRISVAPESSFEAVGEDLVAAVAGEAVVRCESPTFGLIDETPETVVIEPGAPFASGIDISDAQIEAGGTVDATCTVWDAYGNVIEDAMPELGVAPAGQGIDVAGLSVTIETADVYTLSCYVPGLVHEQAKNVEVVPGPPASLVIGRQPNEQVYAIGQVVGITWVVTDEYGNVIPNPAITFSSSPPGSSFGFGRFRYFDEGVYTVTVTVTGTANGTPLTAQTTIVVNSEGPSIQCDDPFDGEMVDVAPGTKVTFSGAVNDVNGVQSVTVNGSGVTVAGDGTFTNSITSRYGINFVEIVAVDQFGEENSRSCAFLVSDNWQPESGYMNDSVVLKLRQEAVDDSNTADFDSLNDMLSAVVNSQGVIDEVDASLTAANPLKPLSCDRESCTFLGCVCWYSSRVRYNAGTFDIGGPNTTSLTLVNDGLNAVATLRDLGMRVRVDGKAAGIPYDTTGDVDISYVTVDLTLDLDLQNNKPSASVRAVNSVQVGSVSTNFSGLDGFIINIVVALFEGMVRDLIADTIRDYIETSFDQLLDSVFGSLDVNTLGTTFDVPQLDGTGTVPVAFNLRFSRLGVSSSRTAIGIGTRFTSPPTQSIPSLGVALPPGNVYLEPWTSEPVSVAVHVGVLNHVLHSLWRGGLFDATLTGADLGNALPASATAVIEANLPPVVNNLGNGTTQLMLGGLDLAVTYPGIFDDPLRVRLGAVASTSVNLSGDDLTFSGIQIDELVFSTQDVSLDATTRQVLEDFLLVIVQAFVDSSLNQSLPALPIPAFTISPTLGQYGLPVNAEVGIVNPALDDTTRHYILEGDFGVR